MFRKVDLFPCSGEGRETPPLLGLLERASRDLDKVFLSNPTKQVSFIPTKNGSRSSFGNIVFSSRLEFRMTDKAQNPVILAVIMHRQNPLQDRNCSVKARK
jgi:hypothetical protein